MKYFEVSFTIRPYSETASDILCALAAEAGFESFTTENELLKGYIQQTFWNEELLQEQISQFPLPQTEITYETKEADYKNWNEEWEKNGFEPIRIGNELMVRGIGYESDCNVKYNILLDPQMAFGSGNHQTTRMMLSRLLHMDLNGKRVLDAGCGTGVLSLMAALRGATDIFSYDIDEWSVKNTETNKALNQQNCITVVQGDASILEHQKPFDLVLANINRNILLADMPQFVRVLRPNGQLLLSGFYIEDAAVLKEQAESLGLYYCDQLVEDDWACLKFTLNTVAE